MLLWLMVALQHLPECHLSVPHLLLGFPQSLFLLAVDHALGSMRDKNHSISGSVAAQLAQFGKLLTILKEVSVRQDVSAKQSFF